MMGVEGIQTFGVKIEWQLLRCARKSRTVASPQQTLHNKSSKTFTLDTGAKARHYAWHDIKTDHWK